VSGRISVCWLELNCCYRFRSDNLESAAERLPEDVRGSDDPAMAKCSCELSNSRAGGRREESKSRTMAVYALENNLKRKGKEC